MFIWGLNVVAIKFLVAELSPLAMQGTRIFIAGIIATTILYFLKDLRKLTKREWFFALLGAVFGQVGHHSLLAIGLIETSATNAGLILGLIPLTTALLAMIFFHDRITWLRFMGILLGFTGVAIVMLQNKQGIATISKGDVFVFISMLSQAISFIIIKKATTTLSSRQLTAIMLLIGSVFLIGLSFMLEPDAVGQMSSVNSLVWGVFLTSAIVATGLGHILYNEAIQQIGAGETAIFNNLVPFFSLVGAFIFLGEKIAFLQVVGFVLIVIGVILGTGYLEWKVIKARKEKQRQVS